MLVYIPNEDVGNEGKKDFIGSRAHALSLLKNTSDTKSA